MGRTHPRKNRRRGNLEFEVTRKRAWYCDDNSNLREGTSAGYYVLTETTGNEHWNSRQDRDHAIHVLAGRAHP